MFGRNSKPINETRLQRHLLQPLLRTVFVVVVMTSAVQFARAQSFSSGSNGSDGALNLTTPGTVVFDPKSFNPPLNPNGDGIYNFTTINIAAGVTVKLSGRILNGPVFWLAQGDVTINGTIDLSGEDGPPATLILGGRTRAMPGAGGFSGGVGGRIPQQPGQPGDGPAGGAPAGPPPPGLLCASATGGSFSGNSFLVPLVGGSGGGAGAPTDQYGSGGGAGGGALFIASSTSISVNGRISADGGAHGAATFFCNNSAAQPNGAGGGGGGGAIRLAAPTIAGGGVLSALGGSGYNNNNTGNVGAIRVEAFNYNFTGSFSGTPRTLASPFSLFLPTTPPAFVSVVSVNGVSVSQPPTGSLATPDVTINSGSPVNLTVQAKNIPPGTVLTLKVFSDNSTDQIVQTTPLQGTLQSSTATATVTFPSGFSLNYVKATWTQ